MPLMHGKSNKAFEHNIKTEMHEGKPQKQSLAIAYSLKRRGKKMAMGGYAEGGEAEEKRSGYESMPREHMKPNEHVEHDDDIVARILKDDADCYSEGGKVANEDKIHADLEPNEFDDLAHRDELEGHYTGANSGDELDDEQEENDRHDIVKRIMHSLAKKDRNPRPA